MCPIPVNSMTQAYLYSMKSIFLNKKISRRVESGHPWIFGNEVNTGKALDSAAKAGEVVNVYTHDKKFIGRGYINPQSQIMVRLTVDLS